ncbi:MAG: RHS repeat-associated core domain-containing protein [Verrucomicrobiae bacterium]|nr:RHS repeat-associated core domain-containing protein [Verrucomicrobiae bacterium]
MNYLTNILNKVSRIIKPDNTVVEYDYNPLAQIAAKRVCPQITQKGADKKESLSDSASTQSEIGNPQSEMLYLWDGLALLQKGNERYAVEPHASGGTPFSAENSDKSRAGRQPRTGNHASNVFLTGKHYDADLEAYNFLFRNYQPGTSRWTAADPSGFPDGANNWVYVNNGVMRKMDPLGLAITVTGTASIAPGPGATYYIDTQTGFAPEPISGYGLSTITRGGSGDPAQISVVYEVTLTGPSGYSVISQFREDFTFSGNTVIAQRVFAPNNLSLEVGFYRASMRIVVYNGQITTFNGQTTYPSPAGVISGDTHFHVE